jgi:two-component system, chemotaxis family, CheB/CheR fusion protein
MKKHLTINLNKNVVSKRTKSSLIRNPEVKKLVEKKINEISQTKRKLKNNELKLKKLNHEISTYNFISSHDLQEPLRKLQLVSNLLEDNEAHNLSESGKNYIRIIRNSANRMRKLINDLQEYNNTGNTPDKPEKISLNEILAEVKETLEETINEKHAVIVTNRLCKTTGIRFQIRKLFRDLLINSLRYTREGVQPKIIIKSKIKRSCDIGIKNAPKSKRFCHITISDNGLGFDPKYNDQIFGIFKKLNRNQPGTGIGLAICKKIVENHNGIIKATGMPGKGTIIEVFLPY